MSVVAAIRAMLGEGLSIEQALAAAEAIEQAVQPQRTARQERNRRYYEARKASEKRLKASESVLGASETSELRRPSSPPSTPSPDKETSPLHPPKENNLFPDLPPQSAVGRAKGEQTPRQELETVLDAQHAGWVLEHRQRLRKPLTGRAAHQLAERLAKCPDPNAAADLMIEKGWQSITPEWIENQPRGSPNGAPRPETALERRKRELAERIENEHGIGRERGGDHQAAGGVVLRLEDHR